jgi:hypothetical protein
MFDNLREDAAASPFYEEEEAATLQPVKSSEPFFAATGSRRILGMTGVQRFILSVMMFMAVCLVGGMALLVTGKIGF